MVKERWPQIVNRSSKPLAYFVAKMDEMPANDWRKCWRCEASVVVPERVKSGHSEHEAAPNVIFFEHFFKDYVDRAIERWHIACAVTPPPRPREYAPNAVPDGLAAAFAPARVPGDCRERSTCRRRRYLTTGNSSAIPRANRSE